MRRFLSLYICIICALSAIAFDFSNETLNYRVEYKWGLINKTAGSVSMRLSASTDRYSCRLVASSAPWADKFFKVRDTLTCEIDRNGFLPQKYVKHSHEGGDDKYESVSYSYSGGSVSALCTRKKFNGSKLVADEQRTLSADGTTLDMLSAFYYMRNLPYESWQAGYMLKASIFSGKAKETLTIKYVGVETVSVDKKSYVCFHIKFMFTSKGGKRSSEDIDGWIDTSSRIPVKLEGSLPIGKIRCFYTGK